MILKLSAASLYAIICGPEVLSQIIIVSIARLCRLTALWAVLFACAESADGPGAKCHTVRGAVLAVEAGYFIVLFAVCL